MVAFYPENKMQYCIFEMYYNIDSPKFFDSIQSIEIQLKWYIKEGWRPNMS